MSNCQETQVYSRHYFSLSLYIGQGNRASQDKEHCCFKLTSMRELHFLSSFHTCKKTISDLLSVAAEATEEKVDDQTSVSASKDILVRNTVGYLRTIPDLNNCVTCPGRSSLNIEVPFNTK